MTETSRPPEANPEYDVAIVGLGPTGAALAGLLGCMKLRVLAVDRSAAVYPRPRAVGFDHDGMRIFQRIGVAEAIGAHVERFRDAVYLGADGQPIRRVQPVERPFPYHWAPNLSCDQPRIEAVLRDALAAMPTVSVHLGCEAVALHEHSSHVDLELATARSEAQRVSAAWVVGCDGASSMVRRQMGVRLRSLDYDKPWIVVDVQVDPSLAARLPSTNIQYCEPARPSTYIVCPGNHRRWEFMLDDTESPEEMARPENVWRLLARWLRPGEATLWRAAAYRFHALVAQRMRSGRLLLAGDSAHQTPPFLGQGMCQGLRDAGNLAWKLNLVVQGRASDALLDSYEAERIPHVEATTHIAKELGLLISERDPQRARQRDTDALAHNGGSAMTVVRQSLIPGLTAGYLDPCESAGRGQGFPQPIVSDAAGRERLLDDVGGADLRLVIGALADWRDYLRTAGRHRMSLVVVHRADAMPDADADAGEHPALDVVHVYERGTLLADWLHALGADGALVRPDQYVYGSFRGVQEAEALMAAAFRHCGMDGRCRETSETSASYA